MINLSAVIMPEDEEEKNYLKIAKKPVERE